MPQEPRKKRSKLKKLNITARDRWEKILKDVEKKEVPVTVLDSIVLNLVDGTVIEINVQQLLTEAEDPNEVEEMLNKKLNQLDNIIKDVDFYVNVDEVAKVVQPITDNFLKHIT